MEYDYLVYIGRFNPVHSGHVHVIKRALERCKHLIIVIGSDQKAPDIRNPLNTFDRIALISASLDEDDLKRIDFAPQTDYTYNDDRWIASIQASVRTIYMNKPKFHPEPFKVGIVGYNKDHTSYYLKKFPQWEFVPITPINSQNSTDFRTALFENKEKVWKQYCSTFEVEKWFERWIEISSSYERLKKEYEFVKDYKKQWEKSPYPPTFVTVDAVVRQSGHLLVVTRGAQPGEGLWALPGGFVNQNETLEEAVIRELYEETRIDVPKPVIKGSIANRRTFDDPHRSTRGRTISECFDIKLNDAFGLPNVKGSDDAEKAFWVPFSEITANRDKFFEDHFSIIQCMVGL